MPKKILHKLNFPPCALIFLFGAYTTLLLPETAHAIQLHARTEGIITHQIGHLFFLFSMVVLILTITGKGLDKQKGWRLIQYSAFFFILWNLDTTLAHLLDNQLHAVRFEPISISQIRVVADHDSPLLAGLYYWLKLDHLLCVPAILLLYKGLSSLVNNQKQKNSANGIS